MKPQSPPDLRRIMALLTCRRRANLLLVSHRAGEPYFGEDLLGRAVSRLHSSPQPAVIIAPQFPLSSFALQSWPPRSNRMSPVKTSRFSGISKPSSTRMPPAVEGLNPTIHHLRLAVRRLPRFESFRARIHFHPGKLSLNPA